MNIIQSPSPNYDSREGYKPEVIVVHCTDGNYPGDFNHLRSVASQVSSHFFIAPNGDVHQLVDTEKRAWHAGRIDNPTAKLKREFGLMLNPNLYTIGIEVSLVPPATMSGAQYESLRQLIRELSQKYNIPIDRDHIWGHHEIFSKKTCPGTISVEGLVKGLGGMPRVESREEIKSQIISLLNRL